MPGSKVSQKQLAAIMRLRAIIRDDYIKLRELTHRALSQIQSGSEVQGGLVQARLEEIRDGGEVRIRLLINGHPADEIS